MNTTRKTPGQVAFENVQKPLRKPDLIDRQWDEISPREKAAWDEGAAAVLANQWRSVDDPPEKPDAHVLFGGGNVESYSGCFALRYNYRTHWMPIPPLPQPPVDPYESLKKAHAAGKVIQWRSQHRLTMTEWEDTENPEWRSTLEYRIKPWELSRHLPGFRPLADGEEWNPEDPDSPWVESDLPNGYRPALKGEAGSFEGWYFGRKTWGETTAPEKAVPPGLKYRTTRPLPPTKEELDIEAFYAWWADYKLTAIDRTPNRETAYAAWQAAKGAVTK